MGPEPPEAENLIFQRMKTTSGGKILAENVPGGPRSIILRFLGAPKVKKSDFFNSSIYFFELSETRPFFFYDQLFLLASEKSIFSYTHEGC